jgi:hypothetical protein
MTMMDMKINWRKKKVFYKKELLACILEGRTLGGGEHT